MACGGRFGGFGTIWTKMLGTPLSADSDSSILMISVGLDFHCDYTSQNFTSKQCTLEETNPGLRCKFTGLQRPKPQKLWA